MTRNAANATNDAKAVAENAYEACYRLIQARGGTHRDFYLGLVATNRDWMISEALDPRAPKPDDRRTWFSQLINLETGRGVSFEFPVVHLAAQFSDALAAAIKGCAAGDFVNAITGHYEAGTKCPRPREISAAQMRDECADIAEAWLARGTPDINLLPTALRSASTLERSAFAPEGASQPPLDHHGKVRREAPASRPTEPKEIP